jgi:hypothetical protein
LNPLDEEFLVSPLWYAAFDYAPKEQVEFDSNVFGKGGGEPDWAD